MVPKVPLSDPHPPRYWWLLRSSIALIVCAILITGLWFWVDRRAAARVEREIADLHRNGEPAVASDLNSTASVPDAENIAVCLTNATNVHNSNFESPSSSSSTFPDGFPKTAEWISIARKAEAGNAACLNALAPLTHLTQVDWHITYASPVVNTMLPMLNSERELANLLSDMAVLHHVDGNDARSLDEINEGLALADAVGRQPFLISGLVAIGIDGLVCNRLEEMAPAICVKSLPGPSTHPAERAQVEKLIARLLRGRGTMRRYLQDERVLMTDYIQSLESRATLLRPLFNKTISDQIAVWPEILAAADAPTQPMAEVKLAALKTSQQSHLPTYFRYSQDRTLLTNARVTMEMRMAAMSLACRLFYLDHHHWPTELAQMVPNYLPAAPVDPFAPTPQPLQYQLIGGERPVALSVGDSDSELNDSQWPSLTAPPTYGWQVPLDRRTAKRAPIWCDLSTRLRPPTSEPSESESN